MNLDSGSKSNIIIAYLTGNSCYQQKKQEKAEKKKEKQRTGTLTNRMVGEKIHLAEFLEFGKMFLSVDFIVVVFSAATMSL